MKKQKVLLLEDYKKKHPDKFPKTKTKKGNIGEMIKYIFLFILFNLLALLIAYILTPELHIF